MMVCIEKIHIIILLIKKVEVVLLLLLLLFSSSSLFFYCYCCCCYCVIHFISFGAFLFFWSASYIFDRVIYNRLVWNRKKNRIERQRKWEKERKVNKNQQAIFLIFFFLSFFRQTHNTMYPMSTGNKCVGSDDESVWDEINRNKVWQSWVEWSEV